MLLTRWTPHRAVARNRCASPFDHFLNDFWSPEVARDDGLLAGPVADVSETEDAYRITVELPGFARDAVKVTVEDGILTVSAEKKRADEAADARYFRRERSFGRVERRFSFTSEIQTDKVAAAYQNGVLEIAVPKAESARPRSVEVTVS